MTNTLKIATGVAAGTLVGITIGLLFAPKEGSKTRTLIGEKAKAMAGSASKTYGQAKDMLGLNKNSIEKMAV